MTQNTPTLCIGSVLWDIIGRTDQSMNTGSDVPGRITRLAGGVALNIAMALQRFGVATEALSTIGHDPEGHELIKAVHALGIGTQYLHRSDDHATDVYMAIEASNGMVAAIADAHSLEAAGDLILTPLFDGTLGNADQPFDGVIALDGNLTENLLAQIATDPAFAKADLRIAPASPGKVKRLLPLLNMANATIYMNRFEAGLMFDTEFATSRAAADALIAKGARRVLVTDGPDEVSEAQRDFTQSATPPVVQIKKLTGAGDTFMAGHIAAELNGTPATQSLQAALQAAADYISQE